MTKMTVEEWEEKYEPVKDANGDGDQYYHWNEEIQPGWSALVEEVRKYAKSPEEFHFHVWTMCDNDEGDLVVANRIRYVNRLEYIVTKKPWGNTESSEDLYIEIDYSGASGDDDKFDKLEMLLGGDTPQWMKVAAMLDAGMEVELPVSTEIEETYTVIGKEDEIFHFENEQDAEEYCDINGFSHDKITESTFVKNITNIYPYRVYGKKYTLYDTQEYLADNFIENRIAEMDELQFSQYVYDIHEGNETAFPKEWVEDDLSFVEERFLMSYGEDEIIKTVYAVSVEEAINNVCEYNQDRRKWRVVD